MLALVNLAGWFTCYRTGRTCDCSDECSSRFGDYSGHYNQKHSVNVAVSSQIGLPSLLSEQVCVFRSAQQSDAGKLGRRHSARKAKWTPLLLLLAMLKCRRWFASESNVSTGRRGTTMLLRLTKRRNKARQLISGVIYSFYSVTLVATMLGWKFRLQDDLFV